MGKIESDSELMRRVAARDQAALAELYARHAPAVFNLALYILTRRPPAEEVTQDVFFALWQRPERWEARTGDLGDWLLAETRIAAVNRLRQEAGQPPRVAPADQPAADRQRDAAERGEHAHRQSARDNAALLRDLLRQLPREQAQVIVLAYFRGMSHSEIAAHLNLPYGTVKSRLRLGMDKLRHLWRAAESDGDPEAERHPSGERDQPGRATDE